MIRLKKIDCPDVLTNNAARWTKELKEEIAKGGDRIALRKSKYRHNDIKQAVIEETSSKCAYCESKPLHVTHGDIEHIVPKSDDVEKTFDWDNLTLACDICNTNKGTLSGLIDPYTNDPAQEFQFTGPMILHRPGRAGAELTKIRLKLNRTELMEKRAEKIDALNDKLERINATLDSSKKELLRQTIIDHETGKDREYSACLRAFLGM